MSMNTATNEWQRGGKPLFAAFIGMMLVSSFPSILSISMGPINKEFGWSLAFVTANMSILSILSLVLAPALGAAIDRYGLRRCALVAIVAAVPILAAIGSMPNNRAVWIASWFVFGIVNVGLGPMVWSTVAATLFDRSRGLAIAVVLSSSGFAFFAYPPLCLYIASTFGWRTIFVMQAALYALVLLPLVWMWLRGEEVARQRPSGAADRGEQPAPPVVEGLSLTQAMGTRQFWQFMFVCLVTAVAEGAFVVHLFPILSEGGLPGSSAALVTSLMGLSMIAGRLVTGYLCDRMAGNVVMAFAILMMALAASLAMINSGSLAYGAMISLILGFGAGGMTSGLAYVTSRYFGIRAYASILGITYGTFGIGFGLAPPFMGHLRDMFGTYSPMFLTGAAIFALAAMVMLTLGQPRVREVAAT